MALAKWRRGEPSVGAWLSLGNVHTAEQAAAAVSACRYPPDGTRSFGPTRAALYGGRGYAAEANGQIACIAMIETQEGLDNLEAIVATPGLGGVYVGPSDLALSLGLPPRGDTDEPRHLAAVEQILAACKRAKVPAGIHTGGLEWSRRRLAMGFDFVTLGTDAGFMMQAVTADLAAVRAG